MGKKNELGDCKFFTFLSIVTYAFVITAVIIVLFVSYFALVTTVSSESVSQDSFEEGHWECVRSCYTDGTCYDFDKNFVSIHAFLFEESKCVKSIWVMTLKPQNVKGVVE